MAQDKKAANIQLLETDSVTYQNPSNIRHIGDPFYLREGDMYYCYATSAPDGFKVWQSPDMINWEEVGYAYRKEPDSWAVSEFWAPEVWKHDGLFYMFYTGRWRDNMSLRTGLAVSGDPTGPFRDVKNAPFFDPGYATIDATVFFDDNGRNYMYYVIDVADNIINGSPQSHVAVVELSEDLSNVISEPKTVLIADQDWEFNAGLDQTWNEGPVMLKHDGRYYLFYSANMFSDPAYCVGYAVSNDPMGEFCKHEVPVLWHTEPAGEKNIPLVSGPGHNSFVLSPDGSELFIVYHTHMHPESPSGERQACMDRLGFRDDGSVFCNGPTVAKTPVPSGAKGMKRIDRSMIKSITPGFEVLVDGDTGDMWDSESCVELTTGLSVAIDLTENLPLSLIAVYPYRREYTGSATLEVSFNNGTAVTKIETKKPGIVPGYCEIIHFEPVNTNTIMMRLSDNSDSIVLSEVMLMCKE